MSRLPDILETSAILGGITTIYIEIVGDFKDITVTLTGAVTLLMALIRAALWWKGWKDGRKSKDTPDL